MAQQHKLMPLCIEVNQLSKRWQVSVGDLLLHGSMGNIVIGVRDLGANHLKAPPTGVTRPDYAHSPDLFKYIGVLSLDATDIERVKNEESIFIDVGYLHWADQRHGVMFDPPRQVSIGDLVVPIYEVNLFEIKTCDSPQATALSEKKEATLLKIIGALGFVIARGKGSAAIWGGAINKDKLAKEIDATLNSLTKDQKMVLDTYGLKQANLRDYISQGIEALKIK